MADAAAPACVRYIKPQMFIVRLQARPRFPGDTEVLTSYLTQNAPAMFHDARVAEYLLAYAAEERERHAEWERVCLPCKHRIGGADGPIFRTSLKFGNFPTLVQYF